jgi:hypothetical protein
MRCIKGLELWCYASATLPAQPTIHHTPLPPEGAIGRGYTRAGGGGLAGYPPGLYVYDYMTTGDGASSP